MDYVFSGGAAITHKDRLETVDVEKLSITCKQIRDSMMKNDFSSHINMDWSKCEEHSASSSVPELSHIQDFDSIHMDHPFIVIHGAGACVDTYLNTQVSTYLHKHTYIYLHKHTYTYTNKHTYIQFLQSLCFIL